VIQKLAAVYDFIAIPLEAVLEVQQLLFRPSQTVALSSIADIHTLFRRNFSLMLRG
jgi:hypothetical protein